MQDKCPECGGSLQPITDGFVGVQYAPGYLVRGAEIPWRKERRPFAACTACEFCSDEIKKVGGTWRLTEKHNRLSASAS